MSKSLTEQFFGMHSTKPVPAVAAEAPVLDNDNSQNRISELINNVLQDKSKSIELIERLSPLFALRVYQGNKFEKVFSSLVKIDPQKINLKAEFRYQEEKYFSQNIFETISKSVGLSQADIDLSLKILLKSIQPIGFGLIKKNADNNSQKSSKIHCIHSIKVILFRIVIPLNEIQLSNKIVEELDKAKNSIEAKTMILEKLVKLYGLYVPLELLVGGRINYSYDANNNDEIKEIDSVLQNDIKNKFGNSSFLFSGFKFSIGGKINDSNNKYVKTLDKIENLSINMEGGNYKDTNNYLKWINSISMDNIQIVEYKTLIPIYNLVPGLEPKLDICFKNKDEIVFEEIKNLIENDYKKKEMDLFEENSEKSNSWRVGITKEIYESFIVLTKKYSYNFKNNKKNENDKKNFICGNLPYGFIICGWEIKTNANSSPYKIICKWKRKKELSIIGSFCFKFEVDIILDNNNNKNDNIDNIDVDIILEIYCIHKDFLVPLDQKYFNNWNNNEHYFLNCDCCRKKCYYKNNNKSWRKLTKDQYYKIVNEVEVEEKPKNNEISFINFLGLKN
jgi:hypothetical protein